MKFSLTMLLFIIIFSGAAIALRPAHAEGSLYVSPAQVDSSSFPHVFSVQVKVANIDPFIAWDIQIVTDPTVVNATSLNVLPNSYFQSYGVPSQNIYEAFHCVYGNGSCNPHVGDVVGVVHSTLTLLGVPPPQTGPSSGVLFTITYQALSSGASAYSSISIVNDTFANGQTTTPVPHTTVNGQYGTPLPTPDFAVSVNPSSLTVVQNSSRTATITVQSVNSFSNSIVLQVSSTETSLVLSLNLATLLLQANGSNSSILTVSTAASTQPTSYTITIQASSGGLNHKVFVPTGVTPPPYFQLGVSPGQLMIHAGDTSETTVTLQSRFDFTGQVTLAAPISSIIGVQARFDKSNIDLWPGESANSTLTITTPPSELRFRYTINITATSGSLSRTIPVSIIPPLGDVSLGLNPGSFSLKPGESANALIIVSTQDYLWGTVNIAASMAGGTVNLNSTSVTFGPSGLTTASFSLNLSTDMTTAPGNYALTLTAYTLCFTPANQPNNCGPGDKTLSHIETFNVLISSTQVSNRHSEPISILGLAPVSYFGILGIFGALFVVLAVQTIRKRREE